MKPGWVCRPLERGVGQRGLGTHVLLGVAVLAAGIPVGLRKALPARHFPMHKAARAIDRDALVVIDRRIVVGAGRDGAADQLRAHAVLEIDRRLGHVGRRLPAEQRLAARDLAKDPGKGDKAVVRVGQLEDVHALVEHGRARADVDQAYLADLALGHVALECQVVRVKVQLGVDHVACRGSPVESQDLPIVLALDGDRLFDDDHRHAMLVRDGQQVDADGGQGDDVQQVGLFHLEHGVDVGVATLDAKLVAKRTQPLLVQIADRSQLPFGYPFVGQRMLPGARAAAQERRFECHPFLLDSRQWHRSAVPFTTHGARDAITLSRRKFLGQLHRDLFPLPQPLRLIADGRDVLHDDLDAASLRLFEELAQLLAG